MIGCYFISWGRGCVIGSFGWLGEFGEGVGRKGSGGLGLGSVVEEGSVGLGREG